jgi:hypothetical protein
VGSLGGGAPPFVDVTGGALTAPAELGTGIFSTVSTASVVLFNIALASALTDAAIACSDAAPTLEGRNFILLPNLLPSFPISDMKELPASLIALESPDIYITDYFFTLRTWAWFYHNGQGCVLHARSPVLARVSLGLVGSVDAGFKPWPPDYDFSAVF